jgi:putative ABC transport system ATP-binding protein
MLIELEDVYKIYNEGMENEVRALNGVSLRIDRGEFVGIVGTSGSGKSTLMNILGCLDLPTYGEYYLEGEPVSELPDRKLSRVRSREVGFIFQGFNLVEALTALENVELPLVYQGVGAWRRRELAEDALERVGLLDRARHKPSEMSGGQQQRVAIARAISTNPPIIMADEPTGALDSKTGNTVLSTLSSIHQGGATVLLITHNNDIAAHTERTIRISDGVIIEDRARGGTL